MILRFLILIFSLISVETYGASPKFPCENLLSPTPDKNNQVKTAPDSDPDRTEAARVLGLLETFWRQKMGPNFKPATLVLFKASTDSPCGPVTAQSGVLYCTGDQKIYLDFAFWAELSLIHDSPGVGGRIYTLAHEYGHHIQNLIGVLWPLVKLQDKLLVKSGNEVKQTESSAAVARTYENWADAMAGAFIRFLHTTGRITTNEVLEASRAAYMSGDDIVLLRILGAPASPEDITHGLAADRFYWFIRGYKAKNLADLNPLHQKSHEMLESIAKIARGASF